MRKKFLLLLMILAASLPALAGDVLINIDAGNGPVHSGPAAIGSAGDVWNGVTTGGATGLQDSAGSLTTVSVSTTYTNQYSNGGASADAPIKPLVQDYFWSNGKQTVTISGLEPGAACTLYVISGECGHDQRGGELSIDTDGDGNANDPRKVVPALYASAAFPATLVEDENYAVFQATATESGTIVLVSEPKNPDETSSYWNNLMAIQLVVIGPKGQALTPTPTGDAVDPVVNSVSWQAPAEPNIVTIEGYDVYWSVADGNFVGESPAVDYTVQGAATTYIPDPAIDYDMTYYWRVDSHLIWDTNSILTGTYTDNGDGTYSQVVEGALWQFSTIADPVSTLEILDYDNLIIVITQDLIDQQDVSLNATVAGNLDPITDVDFAVLEDDLNYPSGANYTLTDTTVNNLEPSATFTTDTEGAYIIRLTVTEGTTSVEAMAKVDVYSDACAARKAAPSWEQNYYDRNNDCKVDMDDFVEFAKDWLADNSMILSESFFGEVVYIPPTPGEHIEAEDAVNDSNPPLDANAGGIRLENGGTTIGWTAPGEWVEYAVDLAEGTYDLTIRYATPNYNARMIFGTAADPDLYANIETPSTFGWGNWTVLTGETIVIPAGGTTLIRMGWEGNGTNADYFQIAPQ